MNGLLQQRGFLLRKWQSNSTDLLNTIPEELKEKEPIKELNLPGKSLKTLRIHWDTVQDTLHVSTPVSTHEGSLTKRKLISHIAKVYDVLGWFT